MAARNGTDNERTMTRDRWVIDLSCVGALGANPTTLRGNGITSIVRTALGRYTITLTDQWAGFLGLKHAVIDSTAARHYNVTVVTAPVATTRQITIAVFAAATATAPALADLISTDTLKLQIELCNSTQSPAPF